MLLSSRPVLHVLSFILTLTLYFPSLQRSNPLNPPVQFLFSVSTGRIQTSLQSDLLLFTPHLQLVSLSSAAELSSIFFHVLWFYGDFVQMEELKVTVLHPVNLWRQN